MRFPVALAAAALLAFSAAPAAANTTTDMVQMQKAFSAVKSFHCDMRTPDGKAITLDYITPDKFHETLSNGMEMIRIGSDTWMKRDGNWMKLPIEMPQMHAMMDQLRNGGLKHDASKNYTIDDLGMGAVAGVTAHHYRITDTSDGDKAPVNMWVGTDHLPVQVEVSTPHGPMTVTYSHYNDVPDITAPM